MLSPLLGERFTRRTPATERRWLVLLVKTAFVGALAFVLLVGTRALSFAAMGVGSKNIMPAALGPLEWRATHNGTMPLLLKFHKVAGTTLNLMLWHNIECRGMRNAWREDICGDYNVHHILLFKRGGLPQCTRTSSFRLITMFRSPRAKFISALYWYPPYWARKQAPWNVSIANWTARGVDYMNAMLAAERNPSQIPPMQEYSVTLGGSGDTTGRRRAIRRIQQGDIVVGLTEQIDATMVLVALAMGWSTNAVLYHSAKAGAVNPNDYRYNVNAGKYGQISVEAGRHIDNLLIDDSKVAPPLR